MSAGSWNTPENITINKDDYDLLTAKAVAIDEIGGLIGLFKLREENADLKQQLEQARKIATEFDVRIRDNEIEIQKIAGHYDGLRAKIFHFQKRVVNLKSPEMVYLSWVKQEYDYDFRDELSPKTNEVDFRSCKKTTSSFVGKDKKEVRK